MGKYYFTQLASRPMTLSGKQYRFLICEQVSGRSCGVYEAQDENEERVLDDAVRAKRGVREISPEAYEELKKKATRTIQSPKSAGFRPRLARAPILPPLGMQEKTGVVGVASKKGDGEETLITKPKIAELIKIERVNSPKPFSGSETKIKRSSERADRAKIRVARPSVDTPTE
jgi:hypothetical protein